MNYEGILSNVEALVKENKNIVLIGNGNNGKTHLIKTINELLKKFEYDIFNEYHNQIKKSNKYILSINSLNEISNLEENYVLIDMNNLKYDE